VGDGEWFLEFHPWWQIEEDFTGNTSTPKDSLVRNFS
jgi:hypothetical protein